MPFDLVIAVKHDPAAALGASPSAIADPPAPPAVKTVVFEVSGAFTRDGAAAVAQAVEDAVGAVGTMYIIRLEALSEIDPDELLVFAQWLRGRRDEGVDIMVCAPDATVHRSLEALGEFGSGLMPLEHAGDDTPRRVVRLNAD